MATFKKECELIKQYDPNIKYNLDTGVVMMRNLGFGLYDAIEIEKEEPAPINVRIDRMQGFLRQLRSIHNKGILHSDLKSANTLISDYKNGHERIKIIDFGISKQFKQKTKGGGTVGFMAPEQFGKSHTVTPAADYYTTGIVVLEIIAGQSVGKIYNDYFENMGALHDLGFDTDLPLFKKRFSEFKSALDKLVTSQDFFPKRPELNNFFHELFIHASHIDPAKRLNVEQMIFGCQLLKLNEKQIAFLREPKGQEKFSLNEKIFLASMMHNQKAHPELFRKFCKIAKIEKLDTSRILKSLEIDLTKNSYDKDLTPTEEAVITNIFSSQLKKIDPEFKIPEVKVNPNYVLKNFKNISENIMGSCFKYADECGFDIDEEIIETYICQLGIEQLDKIGFPENISFIRKAPRNLRIAYRAELSEKRDPNFLCYYNCFHREISDEATAKIYLLQKPDNHFIIFRDAEGRYNCLTHRANSQFESSPMTVNYEKSPPTAILTKTGLEQPISGFMRAPFGKEKGNFQPVKEEIVDTEILQKMRENINHLKNTFDRTKNIYSKDFIMQYDKLSFNEKNTAAKLFFNKIENFSEFSKSYLKSKSFAKEATTPGFKIDDDICHKFISMSIKEKDIACKLSTNVSQLNEYIFRNTLKMKMVSENTIRKYYLKETNLRKVASYQYLVYFLKKHLK